METEKESLENFAKYQMKELQELLETEYESINNSHLITSL